MLYVFHGTDIAKSSEKARGLVSSLKAKKPDASLVEITGENWSPSIIEEHIGGQGLFSSKYIIFLNRVMENIEAEDKLPPLLPSMNESPNIFILLEGKLKAESRKIFEKNAEKAIESGDKEAKSSNGQNKGSPGNKEFNVFVLGDALGERNAFKSWSLYRKAIDGGLESESIIGTLFWQVKSMILAGRAKTAGDCGLNPFVFMKSKRYAGNYSAGELKDLLQKLIVLYHDGHRGLADLELGTEKLLLDLRFIRRQAEPVSGQVMVH